MTQKQGVIRLETDINTYFENEIKTIAQRQGVTVSPFASSYLARMLGRFSDTRAYLVKNPTEENPKQSFPTLALLWLEGLTKNTSEQLQQFQMVGDIALFTSGFFGERFTRSMIDMDYYIAMGGKAYERAGHIKNTLQAERAINIFFELSGGFKHLVDVLAEISDQSLITNDKDLLKLYEKWISTGSDRVKRMLNENGIIASPSGEDGN